MHCIHLSHFFSESSDFFPSSHLYTVVTLYIMHCIHLSHFFFRVIRFFSIVTLVYSGYIAFPYVMHLYTLVTLFSSIIRKYLHHIFCYAQLVLVCLTMMSWSYIIYCIKDSKVEDYLSTVVYVVTVWRNTPLRNSALFLCNICRKLIQTCMFRVGLDVWFSDGSFVYFLT